MKLPVVSAERVMKCLSFVGFRVSRQAGSHVIMVKENHSKLTVVVPKHAELATGTLLSIISQSGLTKEEFCALLRR